MASTGASLLASREFDERSEELRPAVQVGDPFTENLLIEACLELMQRDLIVAIQDMGAAGLTSSSVEMAGRGGTGFRLNLDIIPTREDGITPYELLLSESQERMLLVAKAAAKMRSRPFLPAGIYKLRSSVRSLTTVSSGLNGTVRTSSAFPL